MDTKNTNYFEDHPDELPTFLQICIARMKSHFSLNLEPRILQDKLEQSYSKSELIEIAELLTQLDVKLSNKNGDYRELNDLQ